MLAANLRLDPSLLARTVKHLEKQQLVTRSHDQNDQRQIRIRLTPAGEKIALTIKQTLKDWWHDFFVVHPEVDETIFTEQLQRVYAGMTAHSEHV